MKLKVRQEQKDNQPKPEELYPEPDRIDKLFNAWKKGGKEALTQALKEKR